MFRYLALLWNAESTEIVATAEALQRRIEALSPSWALVFRVAGVAVLVADHSRHLRAQMLFGEAGVVMGEIFPGLHASNEGATVEKANFGATETRAVIESQGRTLASRYWGNYVAFMLDEERGARYIFKDPCGSLPCHVTESGGVQLVFSCLGDCRELGFQFKVNWAFVRARVLGGAEVREPSFLGVSDVHRGECIRFNREGAVESRTAYWRPSFAGDSAFADLEVAQRALRATVLNCAHSLAAGHADVLAQVSGGLDSSIVLGALSDAPHLPRITCYTLFVPDSVCDERRWARLAVAPRGFEQVEVPLVPAMFIYEELPALAASMQPASYFTHWQKGPVERELAGRHGCSAVFTGEGGDAAFCSTTYVFAVDHCLRREGLSFRTLRTAAQVARRRDRTLWNVLGKALARTVFGLGVDGGRDFEAYRRLVSSELRNSTATNLEALLRLGPLTFAPSFYDLSTAHHDGAPYVVSPLCAQPVVEVCARIPVDVHFDGGHIRGLARRAFTAEVPKAILRRQWKDRPLLQLGQVIAGNLPFIRAQLLDGALVRERILDRAALERALRDAPSGSKAIGSEILSHLDVELWIRDSA